MLPDVAFVHCEGRVQHEGGFVCVPAVAHNFIRVKDSNRVRLCGVICTLSYLLFIKCSAVKMA